MTFKHVVIAMVVVFLIEAIALVAVLLLAPAQQVGPLQETITTSPTTTACRVSRYGNIIHWNNCPTTLGAPWSLKSSASF